MIINPILRGFNPDPSICRVGEDYYIATSTFQYYPGIQIHHSKDLKNWRLLTHVLTEKKHFNLTQLECSNGVWAPQLTHDGEFFYAVFSCVTSTGGPITDSPTFMVKSKSIMGPWSEAIYFRSGGFDPSIFHDDDGKKYWVNMQMGEPGVKRFNGVYLQEYDADSEKNIGPMKKIFVGTQFGVTEGPHIYKRNGYYYLLTAEGGTSKDHVVTIARSRDIWGPYEVHPENPMLTTRYTDDEFPFRSAGHGDFVTTQNGEEFIVHLLQRKVIDSELRKLEKLPLGRETGIQRVIWGEDNWPRLANGTNVPDIELEEANLVECKWEKAPNTFYLPKSDKLDVNYSYLRNKLDDSIVKYSDKGLELAGQESLSSRNNVTFLGHRLQEFSAEISCVMECNAKTYRETAGVVAYYDRLNYLYLHVVGGGDSDDDIAPRKVKLIRFINMKIEAFDLMTLADDVKDIELRIFTKDNKYYFEYNKIVSDITFPITILGDGASTFSCFTGTFFALAAEDYAGLGNTTALIKKLTYQEF